MPEKSIFLKTPIIHFPTFEKISMEFELIEEIFSIPKANFSPLLNFFYQSLN